MAKSKSKQKQKKKGPKGKKARAKAKRDRQWGEDTVEEERIRQPKGRSRLLPFKQNNFHKKEEEESREIDYDSENSSSSGDDDGVMEDVDRKDAWKSLMGTIRAKHHGSKLRRNDMDHKRSSMKEEEVNESSDDDSEISQEMEVKADPHSKEEEIEENSDEDEDDDEDNSKNTKDMETEEKEERLNREDSTSNISAFTRHFSEEPSEENTASQHTIEKASFPNLTRALEVQISGPLLQKNISKEMYSMCQDSFRHLNKRLESHWVDFNKSLNGVDADCGEEISVPKRYRDVRKKFTTVQLATFPSLSSYADVLFTAENSMNQSAMHNLFTLHIVNHILTSNILVQKHDQKLKQLEEKEAQSEKEMQQQNPSLVDRDVYRDQGYTRPKVLLLLPTRGICHTFVSNMLQLLGHEVFVSNVDRFKAEFGMEEDGNSKERSEEIEKRKQANLLTKGEEWNTLFGPNANQDDDFKIGISFLCNRSKIHKKKKGELSIHLYSEFYKSDLIIASPLGLKMTLDREQDTDFLSSIEICALFYSDVLLMQNWDHVQTVLSHVNALPKNNNDTDFSRVRSYLLAGQASHRRQLIFLSRFNDAHILSTFKRFSKSTAGQLRLHRKTLAHKASIVDVDVVPTIKQVFQRVSSTDISSQGNDRLQYFMKKVLPQIIRLQQKHTLIYIPSYFDYVSLRNDLLKKDDMIRFASVTEYAKDSEITRARTRFHQGRRSLMLYTGRAYFFRRYAIKGVKHVIFYGVPEHAEFYPNVVNMIAAPEKKSDFVDVDSPPSCLTLFTKYDGHALERVVGASHCERMILGEKNTFLFTS